MNQSTSFSVAVVIPMYNGADSIRQCVESVLADGWGDVEVLIVDDGSTDDSLNAATALAKESPQSIRVLTQKNSGANTARNYGLREAKANYIQFLDCDDTLVNHKLSASMKAFQENSELRCVYTSLQMFMDGKPLNVKTPSEKNTRNLANHCPTEFTFGLNTSMPVWDRQFLIDNDLYWDESLSCWQESEYYVRVLLACGGWEKLQHLPITGIHFNRTSSGDGISSAYWSEKYILSQRHAIQAIYSTCEKYGIVNPELTNQKASFLRKLLKRSVVGGSREAFQTLKADLKATGQTFPMETRVMLNMPYLLLNSLYAMYSRSKRVFKKA